MTNEELQALLDEAKLKADSGDLEGATDLLEQAKAIKAELEKAKPEEEPETPQEEAIEEKVEEVEEIIEDKEEEQEPQQESKQENTEGEQRSIKGDNKMYELNNPNEEQRSAHADFLDYLRNPESTTHNRAFTTVEGQALIPEEIKTTPSEQPQTIVDMRKFANVVSVNTGAGKFPILQASQTTMVSVAELKENPELANPVFTDVAYDIDTYRGFIPVSKELIADADFNVESLVANHLQKLSLNTSNKAICAELAKFTAKSVTKLADIKAILNVDIDPAYNVKVIVSQTMFNELDQEVATDGRALLQPDATKPSNYSILGREVVIVPDTYLGNAGEAHAFVGDVAQAVAFFDRAQESVVWVDNATYGKHLVAVTRFDAVVADPSAGFFLTKTLG